MKRDLHLYFLQGLDPSSPLVDSGLLKSVMEQDRHIDFSQVIVASPYSIARKLRKAYASGETDIPGLVVSVAAQKSGAYETMINTIGADFGRDLYDFSKDEDVYVASEKFLMQRLNLPVFKVPLNEGVAQIEFRDWIRDYFR